MARHGSAAPSPPAALALNCLGHRALIVQVTRPSGAYTGAHAVGRCHLGGTSASPPPPLARRGYRRQEGRRRPPPLLTWRRAAASACAAPPRERAASPQCCARSLQGWVLARESVDWEQAIESRSGGSEAARQRPQAADSATSSQLHAGAGGVWHPLACPLPLHQVTHLRQLSRMKSPRSLHSGGGMDGSG